MVAERWTSLFAVLVSLPGWAVAQTTPRMVRLSYADPDTKTHIAVTWHSDTSAPQTVQYGVSAPNEGALPSTVTTAPFAGGIGYIHSAELAGLLPDTTYQYRVGSDADGWAPASGSFTLRTAPASPCDPFTFVAVGDVRGLSILDSINLPSEWPKVFDNVAGEDPVFALIAGDLVYDGANLDEWYELLTQGTSYYTYLPVLPSFGNHDDGGGTTHHYEYLYTLPHNDAGNERYYYYRYGNALFLAFNSEEKGASGTFAEQAAWLESVLQRESATWKILFFHHPVWTTTPGESNLTGCTILCGHPPNEKGQNDVLIDLIDRYDIDLVIQSHNHFYERSSPLRGGGAHPSKVEAATAYRGTQVGVRSAGGRVDTWGTAYLVTGGGGATLTPFGAILGNQVYAPGSVVHSSKYHHTRISIADLTLTADVIETRLDGSLGATLDTLTLTKLPQYRVDACPNPVIDNDHDGSPAGSDCADDDPTRKPGGQEICGDGIDQDCSGADLPCPGGDDGAPPTDDGGPRGGGDTDTIQEDPGNPAVGCDCGASTTTLPALLFGALGMGCGPGLRRRRRR